MIIRISESFQVVSQGFRCYRQGVARGRHPMTTKGLLQAHGVLCYVIFENKEHIEVK